MLNSASTGSTALWDYSPGDYLLGQIRDIQECRSRWVASGEKIKRLVMLVEEGTEAGRPMSEHCHRALRCTHVELQLLVRKEQPRVGETLCIVYLGRDDAQRPARHLFRYSIERDVHADDTDF
jgi:hypothetical protein